MTIVSSDKDLMQLVQPGVVMLDTMKNKTIGRDEVIEKFGVPPDKVVDVQSLAGDSTDNVPGVPGIGVKTAAELINEYGDLDTLLARAGEIKQPKRREKLIEFADAGAHLARAGALKDDVPVDVPIEQLGVHDPEPEALLGFLREMEFTTLTKRIAEGSGRRSRRRRSRGSVGSPVLRKKARPSRACRHRRHRRKPAAPVRRTRAPLTPHARLQGHARSTARSTRRSPTASRARSLDRQGAREAGRFAFDTETTSLDPMQAELVGFSMAIAPGKPATCRSAIAPARRASTSAARRQPEQIPLREALALLKPLLEDAIDPEDRAEPQVRPAACWRQHGIEIAPLDDTMLLSYALDAGRGRHGMDDLAERHLGHTCISVRAGDRARARRQEVRARRSRRCRSTRRPSTPPRMPTSRCGCGWC